MTAVRGSGTAERKFVSVLFADLTGFTSLCESLDPEDVHEFLLPSMNALRRTVESFGGSVVQVSGDGFLAVFGAPAAQEDHAERAVRAALALCDRVRELNAGAPRVPIPDVHAGINAGEVFLAPSDDRTGFTVFGDVVNVASRLCSAAPPGGVLATGGVRSLAAHSIVFGSVRSRRLRGRREPVAVCQALRSRGRAPAGRAPSRTTPVFVGRDDALEALAAERAESERSGRSRIVLVAGEAGIGKSRLSAEFRRRMNDADVLAGRCSPYGQRLPLSALASAIAARAGAHPGSPRPVAALGRFATTVALPGESKALARRLRALIGLDNGSAESTSARDGVAAARAAVEGLARKAPVVILLDDVHWADPDLLELMRSAASSPWRGPIMFAGLCRPDVPRALAGISRVQLDPLPQGEMRRLLLHQLGPGLPAGAAHSLVKRAAGNPLFLEESVQMLIESGAIDSGADGRFHIADPASFRNVPATLRALIAARIDGLGGRAKRTLQLAAISGRVCWDRLLDELEPGAAAVCPDLAAAELLRHRPHSSIPGSEEYEFKHPLIRDVAEQSVPRSERGVLHRRIADWLTKEASSLGDEPVPLIAHHAEQAWLAVRGREDDDAAATRAAHALLRWGDVALHHQARLADSIYDRAYAAVSAIPNPAPALAAAILAGRAECAMEQGRHVQARADAVKSSLLAHRAARPDLEARALLTEGGSLSDVGEVAAARLKLERARRTFRRAGDRRGEAVALRRLASTRRLDEFRRCMQLLRDGYALHAEAGDAQGLAQTAEELAYALSPIGGDEFRARFDEARRLGRDEGDLRLRAGLLRTAAYDALFRGEPAEAIESARAARPIAVQAGALAVEADACLVEALALGLAGDPTEAAASAEDVIAIAQRLQSRGLRALGLLAGARPALRSGHPAIATSRIRSARRVLARQPVQLFEADLCEAAVACDRGMWSAVDAVAVAAARRIRSLGVRMYESGPWLLSGRAALGAGRYERATAALSQAAASAQRAGAQGVEALAIACRDQAVTLSGRKDAGSRGRARARGGMPETAPVRAETEGIQALQRGNRAKASAAFGRAVRLWEPMGATAWLARALAMQAATHSHPAALQRQAAEVLDELALPPRDRHLVMTPLRVG